jgi:hypothetical protein
VNEFEVVLTILVNGVQGNNERAVALYSFGLHPKVRLLAVGSLNVSVEFDHDAFYALLSLVDFAVGVNIVPHSSIEDCTFVGTGACQVFHTCIVNGLNNMSNEVVSEKKVKHAFRTQKGQRTMT